VRPSSGSGSPPNRNLMLAAIASATLLNPLNSSMISVALSRINHDFGITFAQGSWIVSAFYLASAIAQPLMGRLSDTYGRKRVFLSGLVISAAASMLAPLSPTFGWLVGFRVLQAAGTSALFPSGAAMIRGHITERQAAALGVLAVCSSTSAAFGPTIGGYLVHYGDWPLVFLVNFPFILFSLTLGWRILPQDPGRPEGVRRNLKRELSGLDPAGILLFAACVVGALVFLLSLRGEADLFAGGVALAAAILFYLRERSARNPFLDLRGSLAHREVISVYLQFVLVNVVYYSSFIGMPTYLQDARHIPADTTGTMMLALAGSGVVLTPLAARLIDRTGPKPGIVFAALCMLAGSILLFTVPARGGIPHLILALVVLGSAGGFNNLGLQTALYGFVPQEEVGSASGLFQTSRYLGTILSTSLLGVEFASGVDTPHLHTVALGMAAVAALALLLALLMRNPGPPEKQQT